MDKRRHIRGFEDLWGLLPLSSKDFQVIAGSLAAVVALLTCASVVAAMEGAPAYTYFLLIGIAIPPTLLGTVIAVIWGRRMRGEP
jgi:hypothetical protein